LLAHTAEVTEQDLTRKRADLPRAAQKLEYAIATLESGGNDTTPELAMKMTPFLAQMYQSMGRNMEANRMNMAGPYG